MFTGIVEELGTVRDLNADSRGGRLTVQSDLVYSDCKIGDSISINGICLTVTDIKENALTFDISSETIKRADLGKVEPGDRLNLERSLRPDSRIGGHFVTGHIDCVGKILSKITKNRFIDIEIEIPKPFAAYLTEKGSIAVDGISLTIVKISSNSFSAALIPHTISLTTLSHKKTGDSVNIEVDILSKYVERLIDRSAKTPSSKPSNITKNLLMEHGFI
jgi:riboflavin synthase